MGIPDHFACLLRILYAGQETIVRTRHGTVGWFKTGKGVCQDYILSTCLFNLFADLEKEMATHSSVLAWRIPGTGEPDGLQSMGSHRIGHDWSDLAAAAAISSKFCLGMHRHQLHPWKGVPSVTLMNMHLPREGNGECGIICIWTYPWGNHALGVRQLFFLKP